MRTTSQLKINRIRGSRLPYRADEAEIRDQEYVHLTSDGIAVLDGEGILYWVEAIATSDGGGASVYDNNAASGELLAGAYEAKAANGTPKSWNPPKIYKYGIYVNLTTAEVRICYRPIARNLRCRLTVSYAPGTKNLVSRVTVRQVWVSVTTALISRVTVLKEATKDLPMYLESRVVDTLDLQSQVTVQLSSYPLDLPCQVTVVYGEGTLNLVSRVTVLKESSLALPCYLYADRTP